MKLVILIWIYAQFKSSFSAGKGSIHFIEYTNPEFKDVGGKCCENFGTSGCSSGECDPFLSICIDTKPLTGKCKYGKTETKVYDNTDKITFGNTINGGLANPTVFTFQSGVSVRIVGTDRDDSFWDTDDEMGTIQESFSTYSPNGSIASPVTRVLSGGYIRVKITYTFVCDVHYYGDCSRYCKEEPGRYTCDSQGNKICLPDLTGSLCDSRIDDCLVNKCENYATCLDGSATYTCICTPDFTGVNCETRITTTTISTTTPSTTTTVSTTTITTSSTTTSIPTSAITTPSTTTTIPTTPATMSSTFTTIPSTPTTILSTTTTIPTTPTTTSSTTTTIPTTPTTTSSTTTTIPTTPTTMSSTTTTIPTNPTTTSSTTTTIPTITSSTTTKISTTTPSTPAVTTRSTTTSTTTMSSTINSTTTSTAFTTSKTTSSKTTANPTGDTLLSLSHTSTALSQIATNSTSVKDDEGLNIPLVAGAAGGGIALLSTALGTFAFVRKKCKRKQTAPENGEERRHYGQRHHLNTRGNDIIHGWM